MLPLNIILMLYNLIEPVECRPCLGTGVIPLAGAIMGDTVGIVLAECEYCRGAGYSVAHYHRN